MGFGGILRQSTAVDVLIGPFVDSTDGDAEETGLTIAQADVRLSKNGQTGAQKSDVTSAAHDADGFYNCELDATDTNTVGQLTLYVHVAGALAVRHDYQVMEEVPFDALYAASAAGYGTAQTGDSFARLGAPAGASVSADIAAIEAQTDDIGAAGAGLTAITALLPAALVGGRIDANMGAISADATAADNLETALDDTAGAVRWMGIVDQGTAQSAGATSLVLRAAAAFADDELIGATIQITGGTTGVGQSRLITDYVSATDTATVETWTTTPTGTITYRIYGTAPSSGGSGLDAAGVRAAVGLASANLDTQLSTIDTVVDAILVDTGTTLDGRIPAALVGGRMDASVGAMAANVLTATAINADAITAAKVAADVTTEIQSGLATAAALDAVDNFLDTEIAAIKAVTDLLPDAGALTSLATQASVNTIDDFLDTEVAAIKAKTDSLTFTVAGVVDANVQRINDVAITGDGQVGTEFGV
jgi:hypothetical protein